MPTDLFKELSSKSFIKRLKQSQTKKQLFRAAFGKIPKGSVLIDAFAGQGKDGLVMASWGEKVLACEQSLENFSKLNEALEKLPELGEYWPALVARYQLTHVDALDFLKGYKETKPHAIYLDPFYPDSAKTASRSAALQELKGEPDLELDEEELLELAQALSGRVVIKRPLKAPLLAQRKPSMELRGSSTRYDIYLK